MCPTEPALQHSKVKLDFECCSEACLVSQPPDAFIIHHHQLNKMEMKFLHLTTPWSLTITHTKRSADHVILSPKTVPILQSQ